MDLEIKVDREAIEFCRSSGRCLGSRRGSCGRSFLLRCRCCGLSPGWDDNPAALRGSSASRLPPGADVACRQLGAFRQIGSPVMGAVSTLQSGHFSRLAAVFKKQTSLALQSISGPFWTFFQRRRWRWPDFVAFDAVNRALSLSFGLFRS